MTTDVPNLFPPRKFPSEPDNAPVTAPGRPAGVGSATKGIDRGQHPAGQLARAVWGKLDLELRRRWWTSTDYGDHPERAPADLIEELEEYR